VQGRGYRSIGRKSRSRTIGTGFIQFIKKEREEESPTSGSTTSLGNLHSKAKEDKPSTKELVEEKPKEKEKEKETESPEELDKGKSVTYLV